MKNLNIIIVDDNITFRRSLKYYIENILHSKVINIAANGKEFLDLPNIHEADIILMDIEMPEMNGINATKQALISNNTTKIIALTSYTEKAYLTVLIGSGFRSCVFKDNIEEELVKAMEAVMKGKFYFPNEINI